MRIHMLTLAGLLGVLVLTACDFIHPDIAVNESSNQTTTTDETIHLNNCGGLADSKQTATRSFAASLEGTAGLKVSPSIIEGSVSAKYGQYRNVSKSQELTAPPKTNMIFTLRWTEQLWFGAIVVGDQSGAYKAQSPVSVELVSSTDLGCSAISQNQGAAPPPSAPQIAKPIPSKFVPESKCPSVIPRYLLEQWAQIGETTKVEAQSYINQFDGMRSGGEFVPKDVLPAGVVIVTDFGNGESYIYQTLPVRAIVHYRSYGVFEVTAAYTAIQTGACMTIMP